MTFSNLEQLSYQLVTPSEAVQDSAYTGGVREKPKIFFIPDAKLSIIFLSCSTLTIFYISGPGLMSPQDRTLQYLEQVAVEAAK